MSTTTDNSSQRVGRIASLAVLAVLLAAPFIGLYPVFMMKALCFAIFAVAFNLLLGFTGLLSFGHAAYLGAAAYFTGWLVKQAGFSPELGVLAGTLGAGLIGLGVGFIAIRRQGIYFAMITLAMAQMVYFVWLQAPFTGGEDGLQGVPRGKLFGLIQVAGNRAVVMAQTTNMVHAVLHGGFAPATAGNPRPFGMPPYVLVLDDADVAAVLTHLRSAWGNAAPEVTELEVNRVRAAQAR